MEIFKKIKEILSHFGYNLASRGPINNLDIIRRILTILLLAAGAIPVGWFILLDAEIFAEFSPAILAFSVMWQCIFVYANINRFSKLFDQFGGIFQRRTSNANSSFVSVSIPHFGRFSYAFKIDFNFRSVNAFNTFI